MAISLKKGEKVNLSKENAGLSKVIVGLGWDEVEQDTSGGFFSKLLSAPKQHIDCDASAIMLKNGKFTDSKDLVYFNNLKHKSGTVIHKGDNLTGAGEGDDEEIFIDLANVPSEYDKIVIVANIYQAQQRNQHFGMVKNAFIRILDESTFKVLCKFDLTESYPDMTAMVFGEIYRHNNEWKFNAVGQGTKDTGIQALVNRYK